MLISNIKRAARIATDLETPIFAPSIHSIFWVLIL